MKPDRETTRSTQLYRRLGLMIVGAQKAGTTGLFSLLQSHPDVAVSPYSETRWLSLGSEATRSTEWIQWKYFGQAAASDTFIGKDVNLFRNQPGLAQLAESSERVVIVSMLRNPVLRARSAYWFLRMQGLEHAKTFERALDLARERGLDDVESLPSSRRFGYLFNGHYRAHINLVDSLFGRDRHVVLVAEDTFQSMSVVVRRLLAQVGLRTDHWAPPDIEGAPTKNKGGAARVPYLNQAIRAARKLPSAIKDPIRAAIQPRRLAWAVTKLDRLNKRDFSPPPLSTETSDALEAYFAQANGDLTDRVQSEQPWVKGTFT